VATGRTFAYIVDQRGLCATILWGVPDEDDARQLVAAWQPEHVRTAHVSLFDARAITEVDPAGFAVITRFLLASNAAWTGALTRQALVSPGGPTGATIAGYYAVYRAPYPVEVFADRPTAMAWLGRAELAPALDALVADLGSDDVVTALRGWLATSLAAATAAGAARALGRSPRSLQRDLAARATTFARELTRARLAAAQRLMRASDDKLAAIAAAIGCGSMSTFNQLFRRELGVTPSAWRAAQRADDGATTHLGPRTARAPQR
jgi:AraC-like DNA-binding protein